MIDPRDVVRLYEAGLVSRGEARQLAGLVDSSSSRVEIGEAISRIQKFLGGPREHRVGYSDLVEALHCLERVA